MAVQPRIEVSIPADGAHLEGDLTIRQALRIARSFR